MKNILLMLENAAEGREAEFARWYDDERLAQTAALHESFERARRFDLTDAKMTRDAPDRPYGHLAMFESGDLEAADAAVHEHAQQEPVPELVGPDRRTWWFRPISDVLGTPTDPHAPSRKHLFAFSNAVDGRDDEFNEWYNGTHLEEILAVDASLLNAQRFQLVADARMTRDSVDAPFRYVAVYEVSDIEAADSGIYGLSRTARDEAIAAGRKPPLTVSTSMSRDMRTWWWTSAGPLVDRSTIGRERTQAAR